LNSREGSYLVFTKEVFHPSFPLVVFFFQVISYAVLDPTIDLL
jgi:hypothetical protein